MPNVRSNSVINMKDIQFPYMGWRYHEHKKKNENHVKTPPVRYWVRKFGRGKTIAIWSKKMAFKFFEELKKCRDEIEAIKVVPGGQNIYNKLTNNNNKSGSTTNISKNDVKAVSLESKVGKLETKIADIEKEMNM